MSGLLTVSPSPHIRSRSTTTGIMRDVLIALAPAAAASVINFGYRALLVIAVCTMSCVVFEWVFEKIVKRPNSVRDLSAAVTGVLLAFNLPVTMPLWQAVAGSFAAVVLVKQLFGGIGKNFANPAITARIFMFLAFSQTMTVWLPYGANSLLTLQSALPPDGVTMATPVAALGGGSGGVYSIWHLLLGTHGGCLGETCALALILGGIYLYFRKVVTWETPVVYIAAVFALSAAFGWDPVRSVLSGGLLLGAIFMATDYVTTPLTFTGRVAFGLGAGVLTVIFRVYSSYPEGVSFAILLMNILTPYINRWTVKKPLGGVVK